MSPIAETSTGITTMKMFGYTGAIALFEYLNIADTQLYILGLLMMIDFIFGIGKQFVINRTNITSHKAWLGAFKKVSTLLLIMSLRLMFKGIDIDGTFYIKGVLSIFIMAETYSILQNIYCIRTGRLTTEYDVVSKVIKALGDMIVNIIESRVGSINNDLNNNNKKNNK